MIDKERVSVLYIVGKDISTSIPLEVAGAMGNDERVNLTVAAFKESNANRSGNFDCTVIPLRARTFYDPKGVWKLYRFIAAWRPDVVHVHHTASAFWGAIIAKLSTGAAVIRTEHNNQQCYTISQNIVHWCSQLLADRILCNSKSTYRNLYTLQKWAAGESWKVVHNGVDVDRIEAASKRKISLFGEVLEDRMVVGSVGRLVNQKNYERLIRAFPYVLEEVPDAHLCLVGNGKNRDRLEREAITQGIEERVTFTGELPRDEVYSVLHRLDLFVMPSLWEGFCNAVVEAMVAGNPVVCSDISTLREVVGEVGCYVDPKYPKGIAKKIISILNMEEEEKKEKEKSCKNMAERKFSIESTAESYLDNYVEVKNEGSKK